jgi:hypothetical protein
MEPSVSSELSEKFLEIVSPRPGETLFLALNAYKIVFEAILKDVPKDRMEWWFRSALVDLYTAMANGIKDGVFLLTNERFVFLKRKVEREGASIWKSHHYEVEESVHLKDIIGLKVKEDILEIIYRKGAEADVLYCAGFYEMNPKQPGYESLPKAVSTGEVAGIVNECRRASR